MSTSDESAEVAYRAHIGDGIHLAPDAWRQMFVAGYAAAQPHEPAERNKVIATMLDMRAVALSTGKPVSLTGDNCTEIINALHATPREPGGWQPIKTAEPNVFVLIELAGCNIPSVGYIDMDGAAWIAGECYSTPHRWHRLPKITPEQPETKAAMQCAAVRASTDHARCQLDAGHEGRHDYDNDRALTKGTEHG